MAASQHRSMRSSSIAPTCLLVQVSASAHKTTGVFAHKNHRPLGPCSRAMSRAVWGSLGGDRPDLLFGSGFSFRAYDYRVTSLTRKRTPLSPFGRTMPMLLWRSWGGGRSPLSEVPLYVEQTAPDVRGNVTIFDQRIQFGFRRVPGILNFGAARVSQFVGGKSLRSRPNSG